ncbi:Chaperone protein SicA [Pandoraea captiosa]|uniref:Chaperone protein SicA n=1 Tax=Pandoraea captiosa TaxID=2508302 RepID=A0A5E4ZRK3_9BURK|nr:type III secretion system translocator chaperone SicA [Pandoraea captiosa]VVE63646.1 Chaperone protein SicA [Pandoraea captiosa]
MEREDMRHLWRWHTVGNDAGVPANEIDNDDAAQTGACLRAMAQQAYAGLTRRVSIDGLVLPAAHELFPDPSAPRLLQRLSAGMSCGVGRRIARVRLSDAARLALASHDRARVAFERSQARAMQADAVVAEVQLVLEILSPNDPQYARASRKRHAALAEARDAATQADQGYRRLRESAVESWIRHLARLPDFPQTRAASSRGSRSGNHSRGEHRAFWGRPANGCRRAAVSRLAFIPVTRLANRRLTRFRVSEGGNSMTQAATQSDTDEGRVTNAIWNAVIAGASLKDIHGIPSETMDGLYAHAYDFYTNGQLAQAEAFFRFLCIYDFYNPEYIVGLAAVCQLKEEYQKAVDLYAMAFAVGKNDYRPVFYAGQCQLMMRNLPLARECFSLVCESSCDADLRTKARAYLDATGPGDDDRKASGSGDSPEAPATGGTPDDKEAA